MAKNVKSAKLKKNRPGLAPTIPKSTASISPKSISQGDQSRRPWPLVGPILIIFAVLLGSIIIMWISYEILKRQSLSGDHLTEFGSQAMALLVSLVTGAFYLWLGKIKLFPDPIYAAQKVERPQEVRVIANPLAITLFSIAWLASWAYANALTSSLRGSLFDKSRLGINITENDALRLSAELVGTVSLGILFPLLAVSALLVGLATIPKLSVRALLIPSTIFWFLTNALNNGKEILATGRPPLYVVLRTVLRVPEGPLTSSELTLLWLINIVVFFAGCWAFALYGRIWTALGFRLRRWFFKDGAPMPQ